MIEFGLALMLVLLAVFTISMVRAAYRNGVVDGYGYSRSPWHTDYQEAGRYLRKHCTERWPELRMYNRTNNICDDESWENN